VQSSVAFLARILRFLFWVVVAVWLGRKLVRLFAPAEPRGVRPASPLVSKPLYRDPWCGTHVSAEIAHRLEQGGQVLYFCSAECRERYQASERRAASG
jgi:YHS domain-containing protein